jgi:RNA polymerase sigma-70 factor (ECF subfamily)
MAETKSTVTTAERYEQLDARDRALVRLIAAGDRLAFDHLFRAYRPRLERFIGQITHRSLLLDELIDDTMLVVWRRADTFNYSSRVSTWIFAIAHRHALKPLRRPMEHGTGQLDETGGATDNEPERRLIDKQQRDLVRSALAVLSAEQRVVVELTYYHGYAYREIAQIVGCPVDTVKTRMFHARRKLRLALQAHEMEGD